MLEMKCAKIRNVAFVCFILASSILLSDSAYARRIKDSQALTPEEILAKQGYYMRPGADSELSQIKIVSFDWGGVLSEVAGNKEFAGKVGGIFKSLQSRGIKIVIVSKGGDQEIKNKLNILGLGQYVESVYQAFSQEPTLTKRAILEKIAEDNDCKDGQIVHFEDTPGLIKTIDYRMDDQPHITVVGVVGRKKSDVMFEEDARRILDVSSIAIANLQTGFDKILELLGLRAE